MATFATTWEDPMNDMMAMIHELSLRTAIATTYRAPQNPFSLLDDPYYDIPSLGLTDTQSDVFVPNLSSVNRTLSQRVNASTAYPENVYQSHFGWLGGAVAIIALTFGAILPVFGGWWHLGRPVSMSPIETAKAFKAPLLREADGNGTARDIVAQVGGLQVQYGASAAAKEDLLQERTGIRLISLITSSLFVLTHAHQAEG